MKNDSVKTEERICQDVLEYLDDDRDYNDELLFLDFCKVILKMIENSEFSDDAYNEVCSLLQSKISCDNLFCDKKFVLGAFYGATRVLNAHLYELEQFKLDVERRKLLNGPDRDILLELINRDNVSSEELSEVTGVCLEDLCFKLVLFEQYGLCLRDGLGKVWRYSASSLLKSLVASEELQVDKIKKIVR